MICKKSKHDFEKNYHLHFWRYISANYNEAHPNMGQKKQKVFHFWQNRVDFILVDTVNRKIISRFIFFTFSLHWKNLIFSVSNDNIDWFLNFEPDSVILSVEDLIQ